MQVKATHVFGVSPEVFFGKIFLDRAFNETLYLERLAMKAFAVERLEVEGDLVHRRVRVTPRQDAPGFVKKVIKGELSYVEAGTLDRTTGVYRFQTTTSVAADRIHIEGRLTVSPKGEGRCERNLVLDVEVRVPLVGGQLERFVAGQLRESFDKGARYTEAWIEQQGL